MKIKTLFLIPTVLILGACAAPDMPPHHEHEHQESRRPDDAGDRGNQGGSAERFSCENGLSVRVRNLGDDKIELSLDNKRAVLKRARAASGELYTGSNGLFGSGAEWHQKGGESHFDFKDPYGNAVSTSCNRM